MTFPAKTVRETAQGTRCVAPPRNALPGGSAVANASLRAEPSAFCVTRQSHVTSLRRRRILGFPPGLRLGLIVKELQIFEHRLLFLRNVHLQDQGREITSLSLAAVRQTYHDLGDVI